MHYCNTLMKTRNIPKISAMTSLLLLLSLSAFFLYFSGCVVISDQPNVVRSNGTETVQHVVRSCNLEQMKDEVRLPVSQLSADSFSVLSWNIHKGSDDGFHTDFIRHVNGIDILLLQEAALSSEFESWLGGDFQKWLLAVAFERQGTKIGIMAASKASPLSYCAFQEPEPYIVVPKMMLISTYPLSGSFERLLVVNVHMVNFTITSEVVRKQLRVIGEIIQAHEGPVIVAGDFNTWNNDRQTVVDEAMQKLLLEPVGFEPDHRTRFMSRAVDGIYYRGLDVLGSSTHVVESSDHNPLEVRFALAH